MTTMMMLLMMMMMMMMVVVVVMLMLMVMMMMTMLPRQLRLLRLVHRQRLTLLLRRLLCERLLML
jgi:hypothetical protein